jgi:hypothetical protein
MKDIDQLNSIFNLDKSVNEEKLPISLSKSSEHDQENDYDLARQTLRNLIIKGEGTLDDMINFARNSEHPRAYEVTGQLIKTMADTAKDLLNIHKQVKDIKGKESANPQIGTQNNVVFAGSTEDLLKMLNKKDDGKVIEQ